MNYDPLIVGVFSAPAPQARPPDDDDFWYNPIGMFSASDVMVTPDSALRCSAVYACVRVLAEGLASLPLMVYRRTGEKAKERAPDHPLYRLLHDRPNRRQTSFEFREMLMGHLCLRGNAYAWKMPSPALRDQYELWPLHPDRMQVKEIPGSRDLRYEYHWQSGQTQDIAADRILHLRGLSSDGMLGISPIQLARETIGLSLATERHGAKFFANAATPSGILEHPTRLSDQAARRLRESKEAIMAGSANAHRLAVLEEGMKWHQLSVNHEDAQFLETRKFGVSDIARIFRVPPHMIGDLERATFSNIEQQSIDFAVNTMRPWLVRWEQAIAFSLFGDDDEFFAEFLMDGMLRGDINSRYTAYATGINTGFLLVNEARERENLNPIEGGDEPRTPLNMTTPQQRDAQQRQEPMQPRDEGMMDEQGTTVTPLPKVEAAQVDWCVLMRDAAERIYAREESIITRKLRKASVNKPFRDWLAVTAETEVPVVGSILKPLFVARNRLDACQPTARTICEQLPPLFAANGIEDHLGRYRLERVGQVYNAIYEEIAHETNGSTEPGD